MQVNGDVDKIGVILTDYLMFLDKISKVSTCQKVCGKVVTEYQETKTEEGKKLVCQEIYKADELVKGQIGNILQLR